jgi:hypothetical protein
MYQTAGKNPNDCGIDSGSGYLSLMCVGGTVQGVKLSESWPNFNFFDFHEVIVNLIEGYKTVPRVTALYVYENWDAFVFGTEK